MTQHRQVSLDRKYRIQKEWPVPEDGKSVYQILNRTKYWSEVEETTQYYREHHNPQLGHCKLIVYEETVNGLGVYDLKPLIIYEL